MRNHSGQSRYIPALAIFILIFSYANYTYAESENHITQDTVDNLDKEYITLSSRFYTEVNFPNTGSTGTIQEFSGLFRQLIDDNRLLHATSLIIKNYGLLANNMDNPVLFDVIEHLLNQNEFHTATRLRKHFQAKADKISNSIIDFRFAKYYAKRHKWDKVLQLLAHSDDDLDIEDASHSAILKGLALQSKKSHRKALTQYRKIKATSRYYPAAIMNIATVFVRQDWWTDAQIIIDKLLADRASTLDLEALNRVYLFKGYLYLHKEYYREARNSFRKVSLDSQYANKALLGLILAATNQQDYIGALNGAKILSEKNNIDLHVDESRIILPYIYEKLGQYKTASVAYTDSVNYYDRRINHLKAGINSNSTKDFVYYPVALNAEIEYDSYENKESSMDFIKTNLRLLRELKSAIQNKSHNRLLTEIGSVIVRYNNHMNTQARKIIEDRISKLESYRNQAKYGVARLFDNSSLSGGQ